MYDMQNEILATEKVLLEGLRFDLLVELPFIHLLRYINRLRGYLIQLIMFVVSVCIAAEITVNLRGSNPGERCGLT